MRTKVKETKIGTYDRSKQKNQPYVARSDREELVILFFNGEIWLVERKLSLFA